MEEQCTKVKDGKVNIFLMKQNMLSFNGYSTSDHHKRQESYLEDRCEELIKHNENLMNFFKIISEQV